MVSYPHSKLGALKCFFGTGEDGVVNYEHLIQMESRLYTIGTSSGGSGLETANVEGFARDILAPIQIETDRRPFDRYGDHSWNASSEIK